MSKIKINREIALLKTLFKYRSNLGMVSILVFYLSRVFRKNICKLRIKLPRVQSKIVLYLRPNSTDIHAVLEVLCDLAYLRILEKDKSRFYENYKTILDIGAHIGTFTILAFFYFYPNIVIAVEPDKNNVKILKLNLKANKLPAKIIEAAVNDKKDEVLFYLRDSKRGPMRTTILSSDSIEVRKVMGITIDDLIEEFDPDFIKSDCEGAEFKAFLASRKLNKIKTIIMEYHSWGGDVNSLIDHLMNLGFKVKITKISRDLGYLYATRDFGHN